MQQHPSPDIHQAGRAPVVLIRLICTMNLIYTGLLFLISFSSLFLYQWFAVLLGPPFDAILRLDTWLVRLMMIGGSLIYGAAAIGCILMLKLRRKAFWLYAIPAFLMITASLFVVFHPVNLIQLILLISSVISLSMLTSTMKK